MKRGLNKASLWCGAALGVLMLTQPSWAQDANGVSVDSSADEQIDEASQNGDIVVTGIRGSLQRSADIKRRAPVIADVIGATGLGRFPDENVAESLQRITGVQIERQRGEGSRVSIRGLPSEFTSTTLNEREIASAFALGLGGTAGGSASRNFEFSALPSEFVRTLEVYKTSMASVREGGLAGTVIVRTPSALDIGKRTIALSAQQAYESNSGKLAPRIAGLYTDTFANGTIGLTLGGAFTQRKSETHSVLSRGFRSSVQFVQNILLLERFEEERKRASLIGKLEWKASDNARFFIDAFYTSLDNLAERSAAAYNFGNTVARVKPGAKEQIIASGTLREDVNGKLLTTKLLVSNLELRPGGRVETRKGHTGAYAAGGNVDLGNWKFSGEFNISHSEQTADDLNVLTQGFVSQAGYDATIDNQVTGLVLSDVARQEVDNPDNFRFLQLFGEYGSVIDDDIWNLKFNVAREFETSFPLTIKFGASYTQHKQYGVSRRLDTNLSVVAQELKLPAFGTVAGAFSATPVLRLVGAGSGTFLDAYGGSAYVPRTFLAPRTLDIIDQIGRDRLGTLGTITVNEPATVDVRENVLAGYGQAEFSSAGGRFSGNFGVRVVRTEQTSRGIAPDLSGITYQPDAGALIRIPAAAPVAVNRTYTVILPSVNLQTEAADDFLIRFAASRSMSRPTLQRISPSTTASNIPPTINRNNPQLDPFLSNNLDLSFEWYFAPGSILSSTFFYKQLDSLVQSKTEIQNLPVTQIAGDGTRTPIALDFIVNSYVNGRGANLKGVELTFQHGFSSLPGLLKNTGVLLNYTYIDNSDPTQIVGASKHNFNASAYYESKKLAVRVSYTWRDKFILDPGAQETFGQFKSAAGLMDGNISFNLNSHITAVVEGTNLLDAPSPSVDGSNYPAIFEDNGRRILFGIKATF